MTTLTIPPPALPSTRSSAICFCRRSCICCACFIICCICCMFMASLSYLFHVANLGREHLEHRLHSGIGEGLFEQRRLPDRRVGSLTVRRRGLRSVGSRPARPAGGTGGVLGRDDLQP